MTINQAHYTIRAWLGDCLSIGIIRTRSNSLVSQWSTQCNTNLQFCAIFVVESSLVKYVNCAVKLNAERSMLTFTLNYLFQFQFGMFGQGPVGQSL